MEFRKFAVVPYDSVSKHMPSVQQISDFDQEMGKILNNRQLSDDEKVKQYYQVMQQKFKMEEFNRGITTLPSSPSIAPIPEESKDVYSDIILDTAPLKYKRQASSLLAFLQNNSDAIRWNTRGEVFIHGNIIPGSNIGDLTNMILGGSNKPILGRDKFLQVLRELNMPRHYIKNPHLTREPEIRTLFLPDRIDLEKTHSTKASVKPAKKMRKLKKNEDVTFSPWRTMYP